MALADRLQIDLSKLKEYLRIDFEHSDRELLDLVRVAKEQIENFLNNDFTSVGENGESVDLPIPFSVNLAAYQIIGQWYETRSNGVTEKNVGGISYRFNTKDFPLETLALLAPYRKWVGM